MTNTQNNKPLERIEEIVNWTLPGIAMYYRDSDLSQEVINKYEINKIFRSKTFVDVSDYAGKPTTNCRFIFATSKAAPLYQINPATEKWGLHSLNCNSYFKVLDVYKKEEVTQVFLIHIPYKGIDFFTRTALQLGDQNIEEQIIGKSRESLDQKLKADIPSALNEKEWKDRTNFPIGLDDNNIFFSLEPKESILKMAKPMYSAIKKMTNDLSDLNQTPQPKEKTKKKGGFWSSLFGKS